MDKNKRDSSFGSDLYLSLYGSNRKLKPERIKTYAIYKKSIENKKSENFVIASADSNEISVSFNEQSDCKVFMFDKVFYIDAFKIESFCLTKSVVQDVIMGLNSFIIFCKLASPSISSFDDKASVFDKNDFSIFAETILKELLLHTRNEANMDLSLHASCFELHDDKIIDFQKNCTELKDVKIFESLQQDCTNEIKDVIEKPIVNEEDISELLSKSHSYNFMCYANCCCSILCASLIKKNVNSDGFEFIKVGKLIMVGFTRCNNNFLMDGCRNFKDWLYVESQEFQVSPKCKIFDILKPAFQGNAKTSLVVTLSSILYDLEKDLNTLQFVSEAQKILNSPEIDLKLIVPNSLKEYSEEIQELKRDLNTFSKGIGCRLDSLLYRSYKNSIALENEKLKILKNHVSLLTDAINSKKQSLISSHAAIEATECEIKHMEKSVEDLKLERGKMKNETNVKQKVSLKADKILSMKQAKMSNELHVKKLKSKLFKAYNDSEELSKSLQCLKDDMTSLSCNMGAEQMSLHGTLELLMVDMNSILTNFHTLQGDLLGKLNNFNEIDDLLNMWKENTENLLNKFSCFIDETCRNFNLVKSQISSSMIPLHTSQHEIQDIIQNNRSEKWPVLSYYFHKVQIFCDSSFKTLAEIISQLDVIQSYYKAELKAIEAVLCSSSKAFKKFVGDTCTALKSYQQHFIEQEKELSEMTDIECFHHKFKKNFDENVNNIKSSLLNLKQMCLGHNDATTNKWNKIQKDCYKTSEKHADLAEHLSMIHKEMSKYVDNLAQQKLNSLECSQIKDKTENIEIRVQQLLEMHKEMTSVFGEASEVHKKGTDKELLEVRGFMNSQKAEMEKIFDTYSSKLKTNSGSFYEEIRNLQQAFITSKDEINKSLDSLSVYINNLSTFCDKCQSFSSFILEKSERSFKILPTMREDKKDNLPDFPDLILDEWNVTSSTPNVSEKKILNFSYEKEKLISRMKCMVEQEMSLKKIKCDLDSEEREKKSCNTSTMSLPNLNTQSEVYSKKRRNFSKLKSFKKP